MLFPNALLVICALLQPIYGKPLFKRNLDFEKDAAIDNGDAIIAKNIDKYDIAQISAADEELGNQDLGLLSSKRSIDEPSSVKNNFVKYKKRRSPYGVVYSQGKPIGILEPISKYYEFQEIDEKEPLKSPTKREELLIEDERVAHEITKRDSSKKVENPAKIDDHQDTKSKRESSEKRLSEIENNIQEVMSDLGLIETNSGKRLGRSAGNEEDEDLDSGANKIALTKELHPYERNKKEDSAANTNKGEASTCANAKLKTVHKVEDIIDSNDASVAETSKKSKIVDYRSEGEKFVRKKRDQNNPDLMKGLETSGDLTVSGNKSPLASSSVETDKRKVAKQEKQEEKREKQVENEEYEKRLQRNLANKIGEIKEDVKREVKGAKKLSDKKREANKEKKSKNRRKKRTLLEQETSQLDPDLNLEDFQEAHIRKRREASEEEKEEDKRILSWSNINNEENLNKRDNSHHNPEKYEFKYRNKRENLEKKVGEENSPGFHVAQNQDAVEAENTRAIVTRDSTKNAPAANENFLQPMNTHYLDSKRLEKLVSESASLTESIKNERGVQDDQIEVELHTGNKNEIMKGKRKITPAKRERSDSKKDNKREADYKIFEDDKVAAIDKRSDEKKLKQNKLEEKTNRFERSNKNPAPISLEDMEKLDSESSNKRKRRDLNYEQPNMPFKNYRADEEEADDESDEFDDDNFDDRTANFIRKRAVDTNNQNHLLRNYVAGINADVYDSPNYLYETDDSARKKRQVGEELASLHSGGAMVHHLEAIKERNMQPIDANYRRKRLEKINKEKIKDQSITGLSESDIFGGLPQSYEGELTRFKRVKRDGTD